MPQLDPPSEPGDRTLRVLLVDDESLMRAGLRLLLDGAANLQVVGEAGDGQEAAEQAEALRPDVVLMDIRMPGTDGIEGCRRVRGLPQPPEVLMLTAFDTDSFILEALEAGALGFLLKDTPPRQLVDAVQEAGAGRSVVSPRVLTRLIQVATAQGRRPDAGATATSGAGRPAADGGHPAAVPARLGSARLQVLSAREKEIAAAVARGLTNSEIAEEMFLSITTVKTHVASIFAKLEVTNRVQVAICVLDH